MLVHRSIHDGCSATFDENDARRAVLIASEALARIIRMLNHQGLKAMKVRSDVGFQVSHRRDFQDPKTVCRNRMIFKIAFNISRFSILRWREAFFS